MSNNDWRVGHAGAARREPSTVQIEAKTFRTRVGGSTFKILPEEVEAAWFARHPHRRLYLRQALKGELDDVFPDLAGSRREVWLLVFRALDGWCARIPFWYGSRCFAIYPTTDKETLFTFATCLEKATIDRRELRKFEELKATLSALVEGGEE